MLDMASDCYTSALHIKHTRAHQGLARVYHLKNERKAAYDEMTKLIEKAQNKASAFEKRSEYCDRDMAKNDLRDATQLDPLRTYPYRYRAAGKPTLLFSLYIVARSDYNSTTSRCWKCFKVTALNSFIIFRNVVFL